MYWDVVSMATWAASPDFGMEWQSRPRQSAAGDALEAICSWGNQDSGLSGWRDLALRLQHTTGNTDSILCPPPARTPGWNWGRFSEGTMSGKHSASSSEKWEMGNSTPTLTRVTGEPARVCHWHWGASQGNHWHSGLSHNLQQSPGEPEKAPSHSSSLRNKEQHISLQGIVCASGGEQLRAHFSFRPAVNPLLSLPVL